MDGRFDPELEGVHSTPDLVDLYVRRSRIHALRQLGRGLCKRGMPINCRLDNWLVLVGPFVDDYLFVSVDSLTGLEVPEDRYPVTDMLYNVNKREVSSDMCLTSLSVVTNEWQPFLAQVGMTLLLRARSPSSSAMLSLLLHSLPVARAVCTHCKDTIAPTHLDATCPLVVGIAANAQLFATKSLGGSPTLTYSLTHEMAAHFTRPVVDAIMGIACAPCQGAQVDLKSAAYAQAHARNSTRCNEGMTVKGG